MNKDKYSWSLPLSILGIVIHSVFTILSFTLYIPIMIFAVALASNAAFIVLLLLPYAVELAGISVSICLCVKSNRKTINGISLLIVYCILNILSLFLPTLFATQFLSIFIAAIFFFGLLILLNILTLTVAKKAR